MNRITKKQKAIVEAHLEAFKNNNFDFATCPVDKEHYPQVKEMLLAGKTFRNLHEQVEERAVSMTSKLLSKVFDHTTEAYKRDYQNQWKKAFEILNITE